MKLVEAERVLKHINFLLMYGGSDKNTALKSLEHYVDYILLDAIIRCKDCKHMQEDKIFHQCWCNGNEVKPDHFCSYGERKTDETD